jgi:general secretion pathway protein D
MAVRTFYIKNADINDLKATIAATIGSKQIVASKQLNALVVRDSKANLDLIASMIDSLDKSKAEVLIDISLYEVSQNDLLQLGNQFLATGTATSGPSLSSAGGVGQKSGLVGTAVRTLKGPLGFGLGLPNSTVSFFQDKGKAKLLAFTQVHVLDNEQHQVRIGQRVPIKTGSSPVLSLGSTSTTTTTATATTAPPISSGFGTVDNIQYENVGLNIDMQPQVFDDEVQVKMKIESSSVDRSTGDLTPSFNQRTMSSVARIRDGQTTMIAAISRTEDSKQVKGMPFIGLIPIIGRLFSTPTTSNQQNHVVITVTPHILRRADIREEDHLTKDAGRGTDATQQLTLQEIINRADEEDHRQNRVVALDAEQEKNAMSKATESKPAVKEPSPRGATGTDPGGIVKTARRDQR